MEPNGFADDSRTERVTEFFGQKYLFGRMGLF
jgi:hypothetical protein